MSDTLDRDARAVFLPAFDGLHFEDIMFPFLDAGGCSVLIGESRSEYVARRMSNERLRTEDRDVFASTIERLRHRSNNIIVAVDQEMGGIRRLEGLAFPAPSLEEALTLASEKVEELCFEMAVSAKAVGVNMFLAPIADVVTGSNPWLSGRTLGTDRDEIARLVEVNVRGVQRGGVVAVTKHFPGFIDIALDPAVNDVTMDAQLSDILRNAVAFRRAIQAGTKAMMLGPAAVTALDPANAACTSPLVVELLRNEFEFAGLIVSDDLDAPATMKTQSLLATAIQSLKAGVDLLLVAGGLHLDALCNGVVSAVKSGDLSHERVSQAAERVRGLAKELNPQAF